MKNNLTANQELAQRQFLQQFEKPALSAAKKDKPEDLTEEEAAALCAFAGIPHHFEGDGHQGFKVIFEPCALVKEDGQWVAYRQAEPTTPQHQ